MIMQIAVLGLGLMGRPMAQTLLRTGFAVCGWNRSPLAPELVVGITLAPDLTSAAAADVLILMLSDSSATDAVLSQLDPLLRTGQLIIDMGSSDPLRSRFHAARLAVRNIGWVDAPVSGGPEGAAAGTLAIMVGATAADFAHALPILQALGRPTHVGEAGAGHTAKVINQLIVGLTIQAVAEALTLAEASGVAPALIQQALAGGFADSKILQLHGTRMIQRSYIPGGKVATQHKDLRLAKQLADAAGITLPHLNDTLDRYAELITQGYAELDHSALHRLLID
jgi:3-hydroxyisobutyrate dehydrogenase-like beta-hydroxyacid dehydrogenase